MSDEQRPIWERQEGESAKWFARFDRFLVMKPWERSIAAVWGAEPKEENRGKPRKNEPSGHWYDAAKAWKWEERAAAYDKHRREERDRRIAEKEADILDIEYAQIYERVKALDEQARLIERSWHDPKDEKKIAFQWLTPDKIREWRGCLEDIAKETGGRVVRRELTGKDGGPMEFVTEWGGGSIEEDEEDGE